MPDLSARRRVVITGLGVIAPNGATLDEFWSSTRDGRSAAGPLTRFDFKDSPVTAACEIKNYDPLKYLDAKSARRLDRSLQYGLIAAQLAVTDANLDIAQIDPDRVGVVEATSVSNNETAARAEESWMRRGYKGISLFAMVNGYSGGGSGEISLHIGARGHAITLSTGSASGNDVMGYALGMLQKDEVDVMVAGGAEAPIVPSIWGTFLQGRVMSRLTGEPATLMRPFDASRAGFLLGEGAGFVVFEELGHALSRGARIYAEVIGHGRACEAYHPVAPHPDGVGVCQAVSKALRHAQTDITEIDYINAHGTATEANDAVESKAIKKIFGRDAYRIAVSSTKPITGHLMAAAGAVETVTTALAIYHQVIPPTINLRTPAPDCDLDFVPNQARPYPIRTALNLSCGFGGKNACLALRRYTG